MTAAKLTSLLQVMCDLGHALLTKNIVQHHQERDKLNVLQNLVAGTPSGDLLAKMCLEANSVDIHGLGAIALAKGHSQQISVGLGTTVEYRTENQRRISSKIQSTSYTNASVAAI